MEWLEHACNDCRSCVLHRALSVLAPAFPAAFIRAHLADAVHYSTVPRLRAFLQCLGEHDSRGELGSLFASLRRRNKWLPNHVRGLLALLVHQSAYKALAARTKKRVN